MSEPMRNPGGHQRRGGFRWGPLPHYSTTTNRGTRVSVGGCCLPLPIGCLATTVLGVVGVASLARRRGPRR